MTAIEEEFFGGETTTTGYRVYIWVCKGYGEHAIGQVGDAALYHRYSVIVSSCYEVMKQHPTQIGSLFWVIVSNHSTVASWRGW